MFSIQELLDMVATDAVEQSYVDYEGRRDDLPPINYPISLKRDENGRLYWDD